MKLHQLTRLCTALSIVVLGGYDIASAARAEEPVVPGIDVSHFQGTINWEQVGGRKIRFVYVKASEGLHTVDARLRENWRGARQQGLKTGPYHFFHPDEDPVAQAEHFLSQLKSANIDLAGSLPPVLDIEIAEGTKSTTLRRDIKQWLHHVEKSTGCKPILYTSPHFWEKEDAGDFAAHHLWLADYAKTPTVPKGWRRWTFWQHSEDGTIAGIEKKVDLTVFAGDDIKLEELTCKARP